MSSTAGVSQRELISFGLAAAALLLAGVSGHYLYRSLAAPVDLYDNERALVAFLYCIPAFLLAAGSLVTAWSARSARFTLARLAAASVAIYAVFLAVR